jgi:catechol 2,3-dioxygenase-like lactoylglutathione lyase family enzyme
MPITNVIINATDIARSVDFYTKFLDAQVVGEATADRAVLDFLTATIELRAVGSGTSIWIPNDLQLGFRHIGFKVASFDPRAEVLKGAEVVFHLDPLDAEGGVRICFFYDRDGTLPELVEGNLHYAAVLDPQSVAVERALGVPRRPRFDHVALTVYDRAATAAFYSPLGFSFLGTIEQPQDLRGFSIGYLKGGDTVLEVFTFDAGKQPRERELGAPGFSHAVLAGSTAPAGAVPVAGSEVLVDPNGFHFALRPDKAS